MTLKNAVWAKISAGVLLGALVGGAAFKLQRVSGDCCALGAECCKPGASCCNKSHEPDKSR